MRLIDANSFGVISLQGKSKEFIEGVNFVLDKIYDAPTVEQQNIDWGKWVISEVRCPECLEYFDPEGFSKEEMDKCPSCGADMRKKGNIAYLCKEHGEGNTCPRDGSTCSYDVCKHTTDVKYAKNFVQVDDDKYAEIDDDQKRWKPCTESKPKPYRDVIFCDVDGEIYKGSMFDNGHWYDDAYDDPVKNVVAWMPLPEGYKKEG